MIKRILSGFLAGLLAVAPLDYLAAQTATLPISQLPTAVLPLVGTEFVPLVQNGITRKTPASTFGIFSAANLSSFPGATADQQLVAAIVAGNAYVQLNSNVSFFNTLPISLPSNFQLDCNGHYIFQRASSAHVFLMGDQSRISNCHYFGDGVSTGTVVGFASGNNQRLINVDIANTVGPNLDFPADPITCVALNFEWIGGSFGRVTSTNPAIVGPSSEASTCGVRRFTNLVGNGNWMMDTQAMSLTTIEGGAGQCITINSATRYLLVHNTRFACHQTLAAGPLINGNLGQYIGAIFDGAVTIGTGAQNNKVEAQPGFTVVDSSGSTGANGNLIIPAATNTFVQQIPADGQVGFQLNVGANARFIMGTLAGSGIPYLRTQNALPFNFGIGGTDYFQLAADGGYYALAATGGSKGAGTINAHTAVYVDGAALSGTVTSVTCGTGLTGGTITLSGTCALDVAHANSWTALQSHAAGDFAMAGTAHGLVVSENASAAVTTAAGTNGQILTGQTGADPLWETMTGDCTFTSAGVLGCTKQNGVSFPSSFTSGGIPYASSTSAISSSGLLAAGALVVGGGAGTTPATITLGGDCTLTSPNITCTKVNGVTYPASFTSGGIPYASGTGAISSSGALTQHALVLGGGAGATPTVVASLGTSTTLLHGAAAGDPTFSAVSLTADVTGTLPLANGGSGQALVEFGATGVNFNSGNTDTSLTVALPPGKTRYLVNSCFITHASASLTTSTFGIFTAAAGGGTAIVASGTVNTVSTASDGTNNNAQNPTVINASTASYTLAGFPTLFFRVQTPQGSAATADVACRVAPKA